LDDSSIAKGNMMKKIVCLVSGFICMTSSTLLAQDGHFIRSGESAPNCTDTGVEIQCTGKVAGLGETTFEITIDAAAIAETECENPAGNIAPGQDTEVDTTGSSGPLETPTNGNYDFDFNTNAPTVPDYPTCPNPQWTAHVVDVRFTDATLSLYENGTVVDQVTVAVQ
jgi:hypothetical protein